MDDGEGRHLGESPLPWDYNEGTQTSKALSGREILPTGTPNLSQQSEFEGCSLDSTDVAFFNEESHEIAKAAEDSTKSASLARSALRDSSEVVFSTVQSDGKTEGQRRESSQEKDEGGLVVTDDEADDEEVDPAESAKFADMSLCLSAAEEEDEEEEAGQNEEGENQYREKDIEEEERDNEAAQKKRHGKDNAAAIDELSLRLSAGEVGEERTAFTLHLTAESHEEGDEGTDRTKGREEGQKAVEAETARSEPAQTAQSQTLQSSTEMVLEPSSREKEKDDNAALVEQVPDSKAKDYDGRHNDGQTNVRDTTIQNVVASSAKEEEVKTTNDEVGQSRQQEEARKDGSDEDSVQNERLIESADYKAKVDVEREAASAADMKATENDSMGEKSFPKPKTPREVQRELNSTEKSSGNAGSQSLPMPSWTESQEIAADCMMEVALAATTALRKEKEREEQKHKQVGEGTRQNTVETERMAIEEATTTAEDDEETMSVDSGFGAIDKSKLAENIKEGKLPEKGEVDGEKSRAGEDEEEEDEEMLSATLERPSTPTQDVLAYKTKLADDEENRRSRPIEPEKQQNADEDEDEDDIDNMVIRRSSHAREEQSPSRKKSSRDSAIARSGQNQKQSPAKRRKEDGKGREATNPSLRQKAEKGGSKQSASPRRAPTTRSPPSNGAVSSNTPSPARNRRKRDKENDPSGSEDDERRGNKRTGESAEKRKLFSGWKFWITGITAEDPRHSKKSVKFDLQKDVPEEDGELDSRDYERSATRSGQLRRTRSGDIGEEGAAITPPSSPFRRIPPIPANSPFKSAQKEKAKASPASNAAAKRKLEEFLVSVGAAVMPDAESLPREIEKDRRKRDKEAVKGTEASERSKSDKKRSEQVSPLSLLQDRKMAVLVSQFVRSSKLLVASVFGVPILDASFISESVKAGRVLPLADFEILPRHRQQKEEGKKSKKAKRSELDTAEVSTGEHLLDGVVVALEGSDAFKKDFGLLATVLGASVRTRPSPSCLVIVDGEKALQSLPARYREEAVTREYLIQAALEHRLPSPADYNAEVEREKHREQGEEERVERARRAVRRSLALGDEKGTVSGGKATAVTEKNGKSAVGASEKDGERMVEETYDSQQLVRDLMPVRKAAKTSEIREEVAATTPVKLDTAPEERPSGRKRPRSAEKKTPQQTSTTEKREAAAPGSGKKRRQEAEKRNEEAVQSSRTPEKTSKERTTPIALRKQKRTPEKEPTTISTTSPPPSRQTVEPSASPTSSSKKSRSSEKRKATSSSTPTSSSKRRRSDGKGKSGEGQDEAKTKSEPKREDRADVVGGRAVMGLREFLRNNGGSAYMRLVSFHTSCLQVTEGQEGSSAALSSSSSSSSPSAVCFRLAKRGSPLSVFEVKLEGGRDGAPTVSLLSTKTQLYLTADVDTSKRKGSGTKKAGEEDDEDEVYRLTCDRTEVNDWERFSLFSLPASIADEDMERRMGEGGAFGPISLQTAHGKYLCATAVRVLLTRAVES